MQAQLAGPVSKRLRVHEYSAARRLARTSCRHALRARLVLLEAPKETLPSGTVIGDRYAIEASLGHGGMGAVYRARDTRSGRAVAIKLARGSNRAGRDGRDDARDERHQTLLQREYHTLAQLAHPRIIEVYDYGIDAHGAFYTMELLDGEDLVRRGATHWRQACALLRDVASSLAILHSRGLLHRDVSARNVRCTADGRAKLIDFGAMQAFGVAKEVLGTPPFMPPEALLMQTVDARADLYALGALGYYVLTGRHAYPARRLGELRDLWRTRPASPLRYEPELPPALSALVLQLISLDRSARPRSAADVFEQLSTIAGLPPESDAAVFRAYLTTPAIAGRAEPIATIRRSMLALGRQDGGALFIEGDPGSGRSRMLDVCVVDGKLLGATVLRADAGDAAQGPWGVARTLAAQLSEALPEAARNADLLTRASLAAVRSGAAPPESARERGHQVRAVRDWVLAVSQKHKLLIAIDDVDRIDELSASMIAALAGKIDRKPIVIAVTCDSSAADSPALRLLRSFATRVCVVPLDENESAELVRSLFGDAPNVASVASHVFEHARGNPRATMELAQHLIDRGAIRYRGGAWLLPSELDASDLPRSLSASLLARVRDLTPDARELADVLCLTDEDDPVGALDLIALTSHANSSRVYAALDGLMASRVAMPRGGGYELSQRGYVTVLREAMPEDRRRAIHARLATRLAERNGDVLRRADHLLRAGDRDLEAIELLCSADLILRLPPLDLLERALEAAQRAGSAPRRLYTLRMAVLHKASLVLAVDSFKRTALQVRTQLEHDSGLALYQELSHLPHAERLTAALQRAHARYEAAPEAERVLPVLDAIRELTRLVGIFSSMAITTFDRELFEQAPSIGPFRTLAPALDLVMRLSEGGAHWMAGRAHKATEVYEEVLARLAAEDGAGLDPVQHSRIRMGLSFALGMYEAAQSLPRAEQRAEVLESDPDYRVNAWLVRTVLQLNRGNFAEARASMRRAELLRLQDGAEARYLTSTAAFEVRAFARAGDGEGVQRMVKVIRAIAERSRTWQPVLAWAEAMRLRFDGHYEAALVALLPAFELAQPGRYPFYSPLAALHIELLGELGRSEEAAHRARDYLAIAERHQLAEMDGVLRLAAANALTGHGELAAALLLLERDIAEAQATGRHGLALGLLYEARAQVALAARDNEVFAQYAELTAREYARGESSALRGRLARLIEQARKHGLTELGPAERATQELLAQSEQLSELGTVRSRFEECVDAQERAQCALTLLLQASDSYNGHLYGVNTDGVSLLAALSDAPPNKALQEWVTKCVRTELETTGCTTADDSSDISLDPATQSERTTRFTDAAGLVYEYLPLVSNASALPRLAALLVRHVGVRRVAPSRELQSAVADQLLSSRDVTGIEIGS
jgi:hypothetical protein